MSLPEYPSPGGGAPGRGTSRAARVGFILGGLAVLLIAFVILRGGDDSGDPSSSSSVQTTAAPQASTGVATQEAQSTGANGDRGAAETGSTSTSARPAPPTEPAPRLVRVVDGQPQGGIKTFSYKKGDQVLLTVESDTADEIHVHGYDLKRNVTAGGSVQFSFKATIEGRFEIELEDAGVQIAMLEVTPS